MLACAVALVAVRLWNARRPVAASFAAVAGVLAISAFSDLASWVGSLGTDSFDETRSFDVEEAWLWLDTAVLVARQALWDASRVRLGRIALHAVWTLACVPFASVLARVKGVNNHFGKLALAVSLLACVAGFADAVTLYARNSDTFLRVRDNFSHAPPAVGHVRAQGPLDIRVFIGESTTAMHMSVYNYFRDTTPRLRHRRDQEEGFIAFSNVFSTHTHTSTSLLEALSLGLDDTPADRPITQQRRRSIVDVLLAAGAEVRVHSNQGQAGTWNLASSILFAKADPQFSTPTRTLGNREGRAPKPWDHAFFDTTATADALARSRVTFLHAYAGHTPYLERIPPEFRTPVDATFRARNASAITGDSAWAVERIDAYDSAVRYVDFAVDREIARVEAQPHPAILLYFSDHGDAPFAGLGHDSAWFTHEMARVPLILYFNAAARAAVPEVFQRYRDAATAGHRTTLAQIPSTLLDLLAIQVLDGPARSAPPLTAPAPHAPILVRETANGTTAIRFDAIATSAGDDATRAYILRERLTGTPAVCVHRANTLGAAVRGAMVADCLEVDVVVDAHGSLTVTHPPAPDVGVTLPEIDAIARRAGLGLWVDTKNLDSPEICAAVLRYVDQRPADAPPLTIEFPARSGTALDRLHACIGDLRRRGHRTVYYLPTPEIDACLDDDPAACERLRDVARRIGASAVFDGVSFPHRGWDLVTHLDLPEAIRWYPWDVPFDAVERLPRARLAMVIPRMTDPNRR